MFLDEVKIYVKGGDGGAGMVAFRREKYVPKGGPAGGDGGHGGNVVLVVNPRLNTLSRFAKGIHFKAERGAHGSNFNKTGASGADQEIEVPPGTVVRDADSEELLADLTIPGQRFIAAHGGRGGRGNARFKSATNQAPRIAEKGEPGEERWLLLELKLLADVGLVGVPNAGKSTLLSVVSSARPKIAPYPFTTLTPQLGVVNLGDRDLVLADIPGLVEGAHAGVGLGHSFLRHIQRTRLLVHLLDGAGPDPLGDFVQINTELALYDEALAGKPQIVALNKMDLPQAQQQWPHIREAVEQLGYTILAISGVTRRGVRELLGEILRLYDELPEPEPPEEVPVFRPEEDEDEYEILREDDAYRVRGKRIERAARMTYWEFDEAVMRFQRILEALGISDALAAAGVQPGDTVRIAEYELEWSE
jgi:GTP-binding protein